MTTAATSPKIVHESETQRQFIRLQMPALAEWNGTRYAVKDLSSGGLALRDLKAPAKKGEVLQLMLILPFRDFSLDVSVTAEVQYFDKKNNVAGCRFTDLNAGQISILNHVIRAFMAGDVVEAGDVLNVASRDNFVNVRHHKAEKEKSGIEKARQLIVYGLITLVCVGLFYFVFSNLFATAFSVHSPYGTVRVPQQDLAAPVSGLFEMTIPAVKTGVRQGQVIARIQTGPEQSTEIFSPCDCFITARTARSGSYVQAGQALVALVGQRAQATVHVLVSAEDTHRLSLNGKADMVLAGTNKTITGTVTDIRVSDVAVMSGTTTTLMNEVIVTPDKALGITLNGRPVAVDFTL